MMNSRSIKIRRALLRVLKAMPDGYLLTDELLREDIGRFVVPVPTTAELDEQISAADAARQIVGIPTDEGTKWKIGDPGRAWLAEHP